MRYQPVALPMRYALRVEPLDLVRYTGQHCTSGFASEIDVNSIYILKASKDRWVLMLCNVSLGALML